MHGEWWYAFTRAHVRLVVLDTNALDDQRLAWLDRALVADWQRYGALAIGDACDAVRRNTKE